MPAKTSKRGKRKRSKSSTRPKTHSISNNTKNNKRRILESIAHYQNGDYKQRRLHQNLIRLYDNNPSLTTLLLSNNFISNEGAQAINDALKTNNALTILDLGINSISNEGVQEIAAALKTNNTLTTLYLNNNSISNEGAQAIAGALAINNTTLTRLYLGKNRIGAQGAQAIVRALANNTTLTSLDLRYNNIGNELRSQIEVLITRNQEIQDIIDQLKEEADRFIGNDISFKTDDEVTSFLQEKLDNISNGIQGLLNEANNIEQKNQKNSKQQDSNKIKSSLKEQRINSYLTLLKKHLAILRIVIYLNKKRIKE